jgi:ABC-type branched-subunit amino acid transport system ATPase component
MIELLGVGVRRDRGAWLLRNVCATVEAGELVLIVSPQTEERRALIDAVTGRRVPDEGRLWVNHVPLLRATARRIRGLGGLVELPGRLAGERSILWNALAPTGAVRALGGLLRLPRQRDRHAVEVALERVGLRSRSQEPAAVLGVPDRLRLLVARALTRAPEHLVVSEPDAVLTRAELTVFMGLLRSIALRERLGVMVSVASALEVWRLVDRLLVLDGAQLIFAGHPDDVEGARAGRAGALTT